MKLYPAKDQMLVWLQLLFVFFLPLWQQVSVLCIILMLLLSLLTGGMKDSLILFSKDKVLWLFVVFFIAHVFGMLYSENTKYGSFDLQLKLSYILFPLLLTSVFLPGSGFQKIKRSFVAGNTLAALVCLVLAIVAYIQDGSFSHFFYIDYSRFLHTTYFSMYLNLSVLFLLDEWLNPTVQKTRFHKWIPALLIFQLINIILLFARTSLATSFITVLLFLFLNREKWIHQKQKIRILASGLVLILFTLAITFQLNNRFVQVEEVMEHASSTWQNKPLTSDTMPADDNSTSTRIRLWKSALQVIIEHPFVGVGTGDIKDELMLQYARNNYQYGIKGDLNPHNQYLHTTVILGGIGILVLLAYLLIPFRLALIKKDWLYICFLLIILINGVTESIMEVQKGVLLIAYFQVYFYLQLKYSKSGLPLPEIEDRINNFIVNTD